MSNALTWPSLLAHWTSVAQASLALPKTAEGDRWRSAVPPLVALHAVSLALNDLDRLAAESDGEELPGDRAAAIDKAEVLVRQHAGELHTLWHAEPLPTEVDAFIADARAALNSAKGSGVEWTVTSDELVPGHPGDLIDSVLSTGFRGDLYLPVPGTILFRDAPAAFARGVSGEKPEPAVLRLVKEFLIDISKPQRVKRMRQVYRQFDFGSGKVRRDLVIPMDAGLVPGQAQLIPAIDRGKAQHIHLPIPGMSNLDPVPVEFRESINES